jgi:hypothetical protein
MLNSVGERGQPCRTPTLISASLDDLELNFIDILFCVHMSTIAFNNVCGIFLDFRISNKIYVFVHQQTLMYKQQMCFQITFSSIFN